MNCARPHLRRHLLSRPLTPCQFPRPVPQQLLQQLSQPSRVKLRPSCFSATPAPAAMEPGIPVAGLEGVYPPNKDGSSRAPIVKPRGEYPEWVSGLVHPLPSLAKLRNMEFEEATDKERRRYLKLVRRAQIKENNAARAKK